VVRVGTGIENLLVLAKLTSGERHAHQDKVAGRKAQGAYIFTITGISAISARRSTAPRHQINLFCTLHLMSDTKLVAGQIGGSARVPSDFLHHSA
jgi:hypothetical protein